MAAMAIFLIFETCLTYGEKTSSTKTLQLDHFFGGQLQLSLHRCFVLDVDIFTTQKAVDRLLRSLLNILGIRFRIHLLAERCNRARSESLQRHSEMNDTGLTWLNDLKLPYGSYIKTAGKTCK